MDSEEPETERLALVKWVKMRKRNSVALSDLIYDGELHVGKRVKMRGRGTWHKGIIMDYDSESSKKKKK